MTNFCPLCNKTSKIFYKSKKTLFHKCNNCYGIFMDKNLLLNNKVEKARYEKHENNVEDKYYQEFVFPITISILNNYNKKHKGLDFGAGTGPVISKILKDNDFSIKLYDPFFHNKPELLKEKYDYIACCEVIEHFHNPKQEFELLKSLLKPNGKLYCMTSIYHESIDFHGWSYKNDPTHVFIYHKKTLNWIKKEIGFSDMVIDGNLIIFK